MEHVIHLAVVVNADDREEAQAILQDTFDLRKHRGSGLDSWWIAEDDRTDGSDNDSAVFVPRGAQSDLRQLIDSWCEANAQMWREDGYPYAETDVSGIWFPYDDEDGK